MNMKKLDTIQKLLAKAESTTPEEAEALTEAAEKMMLRYGIDKAMIEERNQERQNSAAGKVINKETHFQGWYAIAWRELYEAVGGVYPGIRILYRGSKSLERFIVYTVGYSSDVETFTLLIESLCIQARVAMDAWWRTFEGRAFLSDHYQYVARRDFISAFGQGAATRLHGTLNSVINEVPGSALVLASRNEDVENAIGDMFGEVETRNDQKKWFTYGTDEGYRAGLEANVGEKPLEV